MPAAEQDTPRKEERPLRIMLLGKCGAGKSSSGNTILGREEFKSAMKLGRVTNYCEKKTGKVEDMPVTVIDTPGLFEIDRNMDVVVREILMSIKLREPGPDVFVVVIPLGRMTQEDQETNKRIEEMFGPKVWDYTIVLFTHGDLLEEKETINDVISDSDDNLRNFIRKCSSGFHVFNNKNQEDLKQVTSFLTKIQTLMALNGRRPYHIVLPLEERKIRERQGIILAEKSDEIIKKQRQLEEHYKGEELKTKKSELWRNEEAKARKQAESRKINDLSTITIMVVVALVAALIYVVYAYVGAY